MTNYRSIGLLATLLMLLAVSGCKRNTTAPPAASASSTASKADKNKGRRNVVLFIGDSLTAGYRLMRSEAFPALIGKHWKENNQLWRARGAGVSGETSAGTLRRLNWVLSDKDIHTVFLCIGANDGLRGQPVANMKKNMEALIRRIRKRGIRVILGGMQMPPNLGPKYTREFAAVYVDLAKKYSLKRMPFLLKDVAGKRPLNLSDGIHPNPKGHKIIAQNILAFFKQEGVLQ